MANLVKMFSNITRSRVLPRISSNQITIFNRYSSVSKDLLKITPREPSAIANQDIIYGSLKSASSTLTVLEMVKSHNLVMNGRHAIQALRSLFALQKSGKSNLSTQQILSDPNFALLCKCLKRHAGAIELNDTIDALKVVNFVGVPSNSTITQVLLHLIRHQVNFLSLHQIIFLDFLLDQMNKTPLIEAMQIALPIVFDIQMRIKLDQDQIHMLADCLQFASKREVSEDCVQFIVNSIVKYQGEINGKSALRILWNLCEFQSSVYFEGIVTRLLNDMVMNIDEFDYQELDTTLSKLTFRYNHKHLFYYNDIFCDMVADSLIEHDKDLGTAIHILRKFQKLNHENEKLLDFVSLKIFNAPDEFFNADAGTIYNLIVSLATTDYRPKEWNTLKDFIQKTRIFKTSPDKGVFWMKLCTSLAALNIYKPEVFEMAFNRRYLDKLMKYAHMSDFEFLLLMKQIFSTYKPEYLNMLPDEQFMQKMISNIRIPEEFPLEGALKMGLGGERFVKTGMTSQLDHFIDHVVALDKDGSSVVINGNSKIIEELEVPKDVHLFAILAMQPFHFNANTNRMKPTSALSIKTLETRNCIVVPVQMKNWMELEEFERIPYLMQLIKSKLPDNDLKCRINTL